MHFETSVVYNPSKAWYENRGNWNYHPESSSSENTLISNLNAHKIPDGTIGAFLSMQENHTSKHYRGTITGSGPDYTFNGSPQGNPGEQITATITDNKDGTITVTVTEGGSASSRLKFEGRPLQ